MTVPPTRRPGQARAVADAPDGRRAGVVSRMVAAVVDATVVLVVLLAGYLGLVGLRFLVSPRAFSFPALSLVFAVTGFLAVLIAYLTVSWTITGRTYGDHLMGLRVVGSRGERIRWAVSLARAVGCALFPMGLLWVAVSREKRSVHDVVLRTSVIYDWHDSLRAANAHAGDVRRSGEPMRGRG